MVRQVQKLTKVTLGAVLLANLPASCHAGLSGGMIPAETKALIAEIRSLAPETAWKSDWHATNDGNSQVQSLVEAVKAIEATRNAYRRSTEGIMAWIKLRPQFDKQKETLEKLWGAYQNANPKQQDVHAIQEVKGPMESSNTKIPQPMGAAASDMRLRSPSPDLPSPLGALERAVGEPHTQTISHAQSAIPAVVQDTEHSQLAESDSDETLRTLSTNSTEVLKESHNALLSVICCCFY